MQRVERGRCLSASEAMRRAKGLECALDFLIRALMASIALDGGHEGTRRNKRLARQREQSLRVVRHSLETRPGWWRAIPVRLAYVWREQPDRADAFDRSKCYEYCFARASGIIGE